ncbi:hypothetical protein [Deinococcus alpinitundrae]|uniref:hypothetical protein n=1 Tax=Deinococcus alpinitundrae TaxID=468913 RepID=UPI00137A1F64|nr:hypothetical protein [Deinococcus alpinitundrae]
MSNSTKKFNSLQATRLTLLLALSLTAGIGTAMYPHTATASVAPLSQAALPNADAASAGSDDASTWSQGPETASNEPQVWNAPQWAPTTQAPVIATTRGS